MTFPVDAAALFERYGPAIHRRCLSLLVDAEAAKDAVQEVFLRAHAHRNGFRGEASPFTWLYAMATTHCLQQLRNRKRRGAKLQAWAPQESAEDDPAGRLDLLRWLEGEDEQTVVMAHLRWIDGLTMVEVAEVVGLSRKTVHKRLEALRTRGAQRLSEGPSDA